MKNNFPRLIVSPEIRRKMVEIAREFRREPAKGESILWDALRGKKLDGIKFRRQQPVGYFIVDFYTSHDQQKEADKARQDVLEELGLTVLRIKTEIVEKDVAVALDMIRKRIQEIKQSISSPLVGEG